MKKRPDITHGKTVKIKTGCGNMYVTINRDEEGFCEVFCKLGKPGGCMTAQTEAVSRLITLSLKYGAPLDAVIEQLEHIRCTSPYKIENLEILSCPDGISYAIKKILELDKGENKEQKGEQ